MKYSIEIKAVLKESDPAHAVINRLGIEKAIEKFKKDLSSNGVESLEINIEKLNESKES